MPTISVAGDVRRLRATLDRVGQQQLPYATAKAVNATLLAVQDAERKRLREVFTVRRAAFVDRLVKIERADFATKRNAVGRVGIQGDRADVLAKFEQGGTKRPAGGHALAVPVVGSIAKPRAGSVVPDGTHTGAQDLRARALLGNQLLTLRAFLKAYNGGRGVFVVARAAEAKLRDGRRQQIARAGGVGFGRHVRSGATGRFVASPARAAAAAAVKVRKPDARKAAPRLVYALTPSAPIAPSLRFVPTGTAVAQAQFVPNLRTALAAALATARTA